MSCPDEAELVLRGEGLGLASRLAEMARAATEAGQRWLKADTLAAILPDLVRRLSRLEQLESRFQETLEEEKLAAMAELAAGAGHEINNPLAIIGGRAQLLMRDETDPERRRELALIHTQVMRAHEMIADLRLFARPPQPQFNKLNVIALIDAVVADLAPLLAEQSIAIARSGPDDAIELEADAVQLNVALRALCRNAQEAIGDHGRIEIAVQRRGADVEIVVSDTGLGIQPEERRHIFDPFYSARQAGRGLGLGLSKCWRIVTAHGGRITVESEPGQGARFTITLPLFHGNR